MSNEQVVMIKVSELKVSFFVRLALNEEHWFYLAELYDGGVELPPLIVVRGTNEIIDGRHRKRALEYLEKDLAPCILIEPCPKDELMALAFKANVGGALLPTKADLNFMMRQLVEAGTTQKKILELFSDTYPPSLCKKLIKDAQSAINKAKLRSAMNAVTEGGKTINEAAVLNGVDYDQLKELIKGKKSKRRAFSIGQIKSELSNRYRGNTKKTASVLDNILKEYDDGVIKYEQVVEIVDHIDHLHVRATKTNQEWRVRFEQMRKEKKS